MTSQLNLFDQPTLNVLREVKLALASACKASGLSVDEVCDQANRLAEKYGVCLVKGRARRLDTETLRKWLNQEDTQRFPSIKALPVLCAALNTVDPLRVMAAPLGGQVIDEQDARLLEWARLYHTSKNTRRRMKRLEDKL